MTATPAPQALAVGEPDLVVFDGVCVLCNGFARFVHRHDQAGAFRFATAQSPAGQAAYRSASLSPEAIDTILVRRQGKVLQKSAAVLAAVAAFGGPWRAVAVFNLVPRPIRDWVYDRIARNRYRLFGRHDSCPLPPPGLRDRFVDHGLS
jgi:predicted DCC family thiol-disulfide oxidoreductase YuxK